MSLPLVLAVSTRVQYLVAVRPEIAIFQSFADVVRLASSTTSPPYVDDTELEFIGFICQVNGGVGLCGDGGGLFGVGRHKLL